MLITPRGVLALPNTWAVEQAYAEIMDQLRGRPYASTEFYSVSERVLSDEQVELKGRGTWVDRDGRRYMPFGFTYALRRTGPGYRIVVALVHARARRDGSPERSRELILGHRAHRLSAARQRSIGRAEERIAQPATRVPQAPASRRLPRRDSRTRLRGARSATTWSGSATLVSRDGSRAHPSRRNLRAEARGR